MLSWPTIWGVDGQPFTFQIADKFFNVFSPHDKVSEILKMIAKIFDNI